MRQDEFPCLSGRFEKGSFIGEGKEGSVFGIQGDEEAVVKIIDPASYETPEEALEEHMRYMERENEVSEKANIARSIEVGYYIDETYGDTVAVVMEKIPGEEVHREPEGMASVTYGRWSDKNETLAAAPQEYYDSLVRDIKCLADQRIRIDPNPSNILYDKDEGFGLLDLSIMEDSLFYPELMGSLTGIGLTNCFDRELVNQADIENMRIIVGKVEEAGNPASREVENTTRRAIEIWREVFPTAPTARSGKMYL